MGRILKQNVILRPSELEPPIVFLADQELPDEYLDQVGEHLFREEEKVDEAVEPGRDVYAPKKPANVKSQVKKEKPAEPEKPVLPKDNAAKAAWASFAEAHGISIPADAGRDDIREIVHAEMSK